ncbi:MAG: hypothetical protein JSS49_23305 [Planctomycetes bacterium]|nr:hypothetical protein [Planctomycetota bacterium]
MSLPFGIRAIKLAGIPAIPQPYDEAEFVAWDVPAEDDAFTEYRQVFDLVQRRPAKSDSNTWQEPECVQAVLEQGWSAADESLVRWMESHREALDIWRRGTEKPRGRNLSPDLLRADTSIRVTDQRNIVRLALLEQSRCLETAKLDEAHQWARAVQRAGGHMSHRGTFVQGLMAVALHQMSTQGLQRWAERPEVTADQLKTALISTRSDYSLYESRGNILKCEYRMLENTLADGRWLEMFAPLTGRSDVSTVVKIQQFGYWVMAEPDLTVRLMRQVLAIQLQEIDKPIATRRKQVGTGAAVLFDPDPATPLTAGRLDPVKLDRAINSSMLYRHVVPSIKQTDEALLRQEARQLTLELLLAAQAHRRDHAEFPSDASQLVPQYLDELPLDPFDPGGRRIRYRRMDPQQAVVWSVGEDRNDGNGDVVSANNARPGDVGFLLK